MAKLKASKQDKQGVARWRVARNVALLQLAQANMMLDFYCPADAGTLKREDDTLVAKFSGETQPVNI